MMSPIFLRSSSLQALSTCQVHRSFAGLGSPITAIQALKNCGAILLMKNQDLSSPQFFFISLKKIVIVVKSSWLDKHHPTGMPWPNSSIIRIVVMLKSYAFVPWVESQQMPLLPNFYIIYSCRGVWITIKKSSFDKSKPSSASTPCSL